ncbi:hypothetical protein V1511DRAFT_447247, partial [Dipodascopsis uninucleata]
PFFSSENLIQSCIISGSFVLAYATYHRFLKRFKTARDIPVSAFVKHRSLYGKVVYVGDGDNFRLFHTPGGLLAGWLWIRRIPFENGRYKPLHVNSKIRVKKRKLSDETIHVRLCGIDAPEGPSFGKEPQPYSSEAKKWLTDLLLGKSVRIDLFSLDQYQRAVAKVVIWGWTGRRDVSLEMLRSGWAMVYESNVMAAFGSSKQEYQQVEEYAIKKRLGMWKHGRDAVETPGQYKLRMRDG